jgi:XTP/dITP diphosphohydrolase
MQILMASNNQHKLIELRDILRDTEIIPAGLLFPDFDPEETGTSFLENSLIKAKALYSLLHSPEGLKAYRRLSDAKPLPVVMADDSGLCVDALGGEPGIYSSRFGHESAGRPLSPGEQNDLLLEKLRGENRRSARYICCMSLIIDEHRVFTAQESWEGEIAESPSDARGGFGYDPIFYLPGRGCTVADIPAAEKAASSHRGKATRIIQSIIAGLQVK